jgi:hypothetical protein
MNKLYINNLHCVLSIIISLTRIGTGIEAGPLEQQLFCSPSPNRLSMLFKTVLGP